MPEQRKSAGRPLVGGVGISNPQRVIDKASGATSLRWPSTTWRSPTDWCRNWLAGHCPSFVHLKASTAKAFSNAIAVG